MITFKQLTIQNFLSFGHKPTVIKLDTNDNTLILGKNKDVGVEGYSRNGVGKSSIFQALSWVLFNEGISNIKQDAFVNIVNKKKMVIELVMDVDDTEFVIRRGRKPAICEVLKDGDPYTMHSSATVDDTIEKLIGINFDTFCNAVLLNTTTIPFMGMKPSPQRDFMEKMVGLDVLSERASTLKSRNKDVAIEIKLEEQNKTHVDANYDKVQTRIDSLKNQSENWERNNTGEIEDVENEFKGLSIIDTEQTLKDNQARRELIDKLSGVKDLVLGITDKMNEKIAELKSESTQQKDKLAVEENKQVAKVESNYNLAASKLVAQFQEQRTKLESDSADKSINLIKEKGETEINLVESKALLKESTSYMGDSAVRLRDMVINEGKLTDERDILTNGTCPYCKQKHVDNDRIDQITIELKEITKDAHEVGEDTDRIMDGMKDVEHDIIEYETTLKGLTEETDKIHGDLNKLLVTSQREQGEEEQALEDEFTLTLKNISDKSEKDNEAIEDALDKAEELLKNSAAADKVKYTKEVVLMEDELPDEIYSDAECQEIITTLKQLGINLTKLKAETNPYTDQLTQANTELVKYDEATLNGLRDKESHYKLLIKMLTDNKSFVRKNLLSQYVPFINGKIGEYTKKLDLPHIICINDDLSVDVEYMQSSISYGNMSNGERNRCNFAVSMAFRDLLSVSGHKYTFFGIDEILDNGLDSSGFYAIFKLLKDRSDESIFLISHRDDLITEVSNTMTIIKENGFSRIE